MIETSVLVDSSVWIEGLRPNAPGGLKDLLGALIESGRVVTTDIVRLEVIAGARSFEEFGGFRADFEALLCLETTAREWRKAEDLSFVLNRAGQRVKATDILIAAVARSYNVPLWHADKDFERVREAVSDFHTFFYPKKNPA